MAILLALAIPITAILNGKGTAKRVWVRNSVAKCLDGTQAGYFYKPGVPGNKTFVLFLEGGGLCSHEDDCKARTGTDLGSSNKWAQDINLGSFQSSDASYNPSFYQAHQVFVPYCTGDLHGGTRAGASKETWGFHFGGHLNMMAITDQLKNDTGIASADLVVFAGGSAGGMGVFYNVDAVAAKLPGVSVLGVPVGGYIFSHPNYVGPDAEHEEETARAIDFKNDASLFHSISSTTGPCAKALGAEAWMCVAPTTVYPYVRTPLLILETQIDSVVMFGFSDAVYENKPEAVAYVQAFRANSTKFARVVAGSHKDVIFSPCCFMHTNFDRGVPSIHGLDYYHLLAAAAVEVRGGAARLTGGSLVDECEGFQCTTACPKFP